MTIPDSLIAEDVLANVAHVATNIFEDEYMGSASKATRDAVRLSLIALITTAILTYLENVVQNGSSQPGTET